MDRIDELEQRLSERLDLVEKRQDLFKDIPRQAEIILINSREIREGITDIYTSVTNVMEEAKQKVSKEFKDQAKKIDENLELIKKADTKISGIFTNYEFIDEYKRKDD
jgi:hypothetical protein